MARHDYRRRGRWPKWVPTFGAHRPTMLFYIEANWGLTLGWASILVYLVATGSPSWVLKKAPLVVDVALFISYLLLWVVGSWKEIDLVCRPRAVKFLEDALDLQALYKKDEKRVGRLVGEVEWAGERKIMDEAVEEARKNLVVMCKWCGP